MADTETSLDEPPTCGLKGWRGLDGSWALGQGTVPPRPLPQWPEHPFLPPRSI